jgi:hypothetical protein
MTLVRTAPRLTWRRFVSTQRNLILQALSPNQLPEFFPTLRTVTGCLRSRWERVAKIGRVTDVVEDLTWYTVDVTSSLSFGQDVNTLENEDDAVQRHLGVNFPKLTSRIFSPVPYWQCVRCRAIESWYGC